MTKVEVFLMKLIHIPKMDINKTGSNRIQKRQSILFLSNQSAEDGHQNLFINSV